jgi:hypothetical protein
MNDDFGNKEQKFSDVVPGITKAVVNVVDSIRFENTANNIVSNDNSDIENLSEGVGVSNSAVRVRAMPNSGFVKPTIVEDGSFNHNNYDDANEDIRGVANYGSIIVLIASLIALTLLAYMCFSFNLFNF